MKPKSTRAGNRISQGGCRQSLFSALVGCLITLFTVTAHGQQVGKIIGWGFNEQGQADTPPGLSNVVAVSAGGADPGGHSVALRADGTVVAWGWNYNGQTNVPAGLSNVSAISAGSQHTLALKRDGTVVAWGENSNQQTNVPSELSDVVAISAGARHSLALKQDGSLVAWGGMYPWMLEPPPGLGRVTAITAGAEHNVVLRSDGTVVAWGRNDYGQTNVPASATNIVAISAGSQFCLALRRDGTVVAWGENSGHQCDVPPGLSNVTAIAAGGLHSLALKSDGTVVAWGNNDHAKTNVPSEAIGVYAISAGRQHSLALKDRGVSVFANGRHVRRNPFEVRGPGRVEFLSPFAGGTLFYTLDGSDPAFTGVLYAGPFTVRQTGTLRAVAYSADFLQSVALDALTLKILPLLTVVPTGGGSVNIEPPEGAYFSDSTASVTATPAPGWTFLQWLGDVHGTTPAASLTMTRDRAVRAIFGTGLVTNNVGVGSGSIVKSPDVPLYPFGQTVRLTAVPQPGSYFATWGTAAASTNNPFLFSVTETNPTVTAVFAALVGPQICALTVICDGNGAVARLPAGNRFPRGTNVTLTALPESGQAFLGWGGDTNGTQNPLTVTLNQSKTITANFTKRPRMVAEDSGQGVATDGFRVVLSGEFGQPYVIEGSTNLSAWSDLGIVTNRFGTSQWLDTGATNFSRRLYRAATWP